jgi:phosphohistidine swiveling domain-containing protein
MTTGTENRWTLPLAEAGPTLAQVGGKGASLGELVAAGFPVPPGFAITTAAYRRFVVENGLSNVIARALSEIDASDAVAMEGAARTIQQAFAQGVIPTDVAEAIRGAYADLGQTSVAVRSSATAEDLPDLSFAGQQETFLDVQGDAALPDAVRRCWASLWSARAIAYRQQMGVDRDDAAMAVVVQQMVPAEVSGVLFTANPTTGVRSELVVEAALGLGEPLVGGTVTPESSVVDRDTLATIDFSPAAPCGERVLSDAQLRELVRLGIAVERHFAGVPQDIEWAVSDGRISLLQARPITNLPAALLAEVRWESPQPGAIWVRRQVVEHMPEPLSPLFAELYLRQGLERSMQALVESMGLRNMFDRMVDAPFFTAVNGYGYSRGNVNLTPRIALDLVRAIVTGPLWLFRHGIDYWRSAGLPSYLATLARWQNVDPTAASAEELLRGVRELAWADADYWFAAAIAIGTAKVSDWILDRFLTLAAPESNLHSSQFLRGFPSKTLEAEAELDAIARRVRESAALRDYILATPAERLLAGLPDTPDADSLRADLDHYFARYGHQIYNLDFIAPTLIDAPLPTLLGLKALVRDPERVAFARRAEVVRERDRLTAETERSLDWPPRWLFRKIVPWAQRFAPYREEGLFYVGAGWPKLRRLALELGRRLVVVGSLGAPDDIFFLESGELEQAIAARATGQGRPDLARLANERRELREAQKRLHPPAAVPPSEHLRVGPFDYSERETQRRNAPDATTLQGFAVSAGRVTAPASVILSPADFGTMEPGTILVCPTTTPAWTPLFAQASGLVTDIGGILAHGSIVAREYGIPAVMGTGNATQRIVDGQEITVDGSAGTVTLGG